MLVAAYSPSTLLALTTTRSNWPSSAAVSLYEEAVAPEIGLQLVPSGERCHW